MNRRSIWIALAAAGIGFALAQIKIDLTSKSFAEGTERPQVTVDDANVVAAYANFCRVTGTPEEAFLDFGLNPQPFGTPTKPVPISHRIVVNFYTAKRMLQALDITVKRHEAAFGEIETDVQKRVKNSPAPANPTDAKP